MSPESEKKGLARTARDAVAATAPFEYLKHFLNLSLYRNALFLMGDSAITAAGGFLFWVVVARLYTEKEVGYSSAIISAINLLVTISIVGQVFSIIRFLPQSEKPRELVNSSLTLSGLTSLLAAAVFIAGLGFWSPALKFIQRQGIFATVFLCITITATLATLVDAVFVAKRRADFVLLKSTLSTILKIPLPIAFVSFFHAFGVVTSWGIAVGVALAIALFILVPRVIEGYKPIPTIQTGNTITMSKYAGASYLAALLTAAPGHILPLMVLNLLGTRSNAYFYVAYQMVGLLSTIPWSVSQSLFAEGSSSRTNFTKDVLRALKFNLLLIVPAILALIIAGKWLLLAFGKSYAENALHLLWLMSLGCLPLVVTSVYTSILRVTNRLLELVLLRGSFSTTVLVASFLLMPQHGILIGVGCVWLVSQLLLSVYSAIKLSSWIKNGGQ